jgi:hypothetical protein
LGSIFSDRRDLKAGLLKRRTNALREMLGFFGVHWAAWMVMFSRVADRGRDDRHHLVRISQAGLLARSRLTHLRTDDKYTTNHDDGQRNTVDTGANDFHCNNFYLDGSFAIDPVRVNPLRADVLLFRATIGAFVNGGCLRSASAIVPGSTAFVWFDARVQIHNGQADQTHRCRDWQH